VDCDVCAQNGRDAMGWKSPVGVPAWIHDEDMIAASQTQGQGQAREVLSGGRRSANVRGDRQGTIGDVAQFPTGSVESGKL